jgi:hypothetical protein
MSDSSQVCFMHNLGMGEDNSWDLRQSLLPYCWGPVHPEEASASNFPSFSTSSSSFVSARKGGMAVWGPTAVRCCHVAVIAVEQTTSLSGARPARPDIGCLFGWCFCARQRLANSPRAILWAPRCPCQAKHRVFDNWCLKQRIGQGGISSSDSTYAFIPSSWMGVGIRGVRMDPAPRRQKSSIEFWRAAS